MGCDPWSAIEYCSSCPDNAPDYGASVNGAYCDFQPHIDNGCCVKMGYSHESFGYDFTHFSCSAPNNEKLISSPDLCPDTQTWYDWRDKLSCKTVMQFFMDMGGKIENSPDTSEQGFCCGKMGITCNEELAVTEIDWSFMGNDERDKKKILVESIGTLNGLKSLNLSGNKLFGKIPASIAKLTSLEYLNISHNSLTGPISDIDFTAFANLTVLDISFNKLGDSVPNSLSMMPSLEVLSIDYNRFSTGIPKSLLSSSIDFSNEKYNLPKPNMTRIIQKRLGSYRRFLLMSPTGDIFDQVGIRSEDDIYQMCPGLVSYVKRLYYSYLETVKSATQAVFSIKDLSSSRNAGVFVKKALIAAYKLEIMTSSHYCMKGRPWSYEGITGPSRWKIQHPACGSKVQSPINIDNSENFAIFNNSENLIPNFDVSSDLESALLIKEPNGIRLSFTGGSYLYVQNETFILSHAELHTPSEHRIDGHDYSGEISFYFVSYGDGYNSTYDEFGDNYGYTNISSMYYEFYSNLTDNFAEVAKQSLNMSIYYKDFAANLTGNYSGYYLNVSSMYYDTYNLYMDFSYMAGNMTDDPENYISNYYKLMSYINGAHSSYSGDYPNYNHGNYSGSYYGNYSDYNNGNYSGSYYGNYSDYNNGNHSGSYYGNYSDYNSGNYSTYENGYYPNYSNGNYYGGYSGSSYGNYYGNSNGNHYGNEEFHNMEQQFMPRVIAIAAFLEADVESSPIVGAFLEGSQGYPTMVNVRAIFEQLQSVESFYSYRGSLTSPPCIEGVNWLIPNSHVFTISPQDLMKFQVYPGYNARDTQPYHGNDDLTWKEYDSKV